MNFSSGMRRVLTVTAGLTAAVAIMSPTVGRAAQTGTPAPTYACETTAAAAAGTPAMDEAAMAAMETASPAPGMDMDMDMEQEMGIELLYIDMMIPHHDGIIGLAEAALPRVTDERLQAIAQNVITTQSAEIPELMAIREARSGEATSMPMDEQHMGMMMELMPGMGTMTDMAAQMDPVAQVAEFCAAADPNLAFIDLAVRHHEMAITASEALIEQSSDEELVAFAERVIADQQAEIDQLEEIRKELAGS